MNAITYRAQLEKLQRTPRPSTWILVLGLAILVLAFGAGVVYGINAQQKEQAISAQKAQAKMDVAPAIP